MAHNKKNTRELFEFYLAGVWKYTTIGIFVFIFVRGFVLSPGRVNGTSMEGQFLDDDYFLVNKISYLFSSPNRTDVVQVLKDDKENQRMIKRIIGLPGETIVIKQGRVFLALENGDEVELPESIYLSENFYTALPYQQGVYRYEIPNNEYFLLGDNRSVSRDSRNFGSVHRKNIIGRVMKLR